MVKPSLNVAKTQMILQNVKKKKKSMLKHTYYFTNTKL